MKLGYYIKLMKFKKKDVAQALGVSVRQLDGYCKGLKCPKDVQDAAVKWSKGAICHLDFEDFDIDAYPLCHMQGGGDFPMFDSAEVMGDADEERRWQAERDAILRRGEK